ncbi:hypothetical protein SAMN04488036_101309 [Shimia haliotis]|uniref:DUF805 domain-containing protein n=1 Tax=Shimia haliotis TaxID=1280847 RepID=A0A1I4AE78_9RHOB|nr:hypothetical protein SAMN04488036_101309 [Shimia haliotis]
MNNIGLPGLILILVYVAVLVIPFWKLWKRTGHSPWLSLLMLVPLVNFISLYVLAFKAWPTENKG